MFLKGHDQLIIVIELFLNTQHKNIRFYLSNETSFIYLRQKLRKLLAFQKDYIFFGHPVLKFDIDQFSNFRDIVNLVEEEFLKFLWNISEYSKYFENLKTVSESLQEVLSDE